MHYLSDLPEHIVRMIAAAWLADFVTISAKGDPINTPAFCFPADDMSSIDFATGMPNPAKAERARRNPKTGLMIEGAPEEPIVVVRAYAAVHDRDLRANAVRYIAETGHEALSKQMDWGEARLNIEYWTRILISNVPERIYWWDNRAALGGRPHVWEPAAGVTPPTSDPSPAGVMQPSTWDARDWRLLAAEGLASGHPAHLAVIDGDGFPLPMRVLSIACVDDGFALVMPAGAPWSFAGRATLTFAGFQTLVGQAAPSGKGVYFAVERALPQLPTTVDPDLVFRPTAELQRKRRERLESELARRGASLPVLPVDPPERTRIARLRMARLAGQPPITGTTSRSRFSDDR